MKEETHSHHFLGYYFQLAASVLLYALFHRQKYIPRPLNTSCRAMTRTHTHTQVNFRVSFAGMASVAFGLVTKSGVPSQVLQKNKTTIKNNTHLK